MNTMRIGERLRHVAALGLVALLAACGGSGDGDTAEAPAAPPPVAPPPVALPGPTQVDSAREVTVTVTPQAGGTLETTGADGTVYTLTVPPGAVAVPTAISIAPLVGVDSAAVPIGRLVAGVLAKPSGLIFAQAPTLRLTLPAGFTAPPFGLRAFVFGDDGTDLRFLNAQTSANVATMRVPHFSVMGVTDLDVWDAACGVQGSTSRPIEQQNACAALQPLFDAERARLLAEGGDLDLIFRFDVSAELQTWGQASLVKRMREAQQDQSLFWSVSNEWWDWLELCRIWGDPLSDRQNQVNGRVLGDLIDAVQVVFRLLLIARMEHFTSVCLLDRGEAGRHMAEVVFLPIWWHFQDPEAFAMTVPFERVYCADIVIDAFAPPVLVAGQNATMPVDIRVRFSDGVELPGQTLSVAISATQATVVPAGGIMTTPIVENVTLTPQGTSSTVTITAGFVDYPPKVYHHEIRRLTLAAGNQPSLAGSYTAYLTQPLGGVVPLRASVRQSADRTLLHVSVEQWQIGLIFRLNDDGTLTFLGKHTVGFEWEPELSSGLVRYRGNLTANGMRIEFYLGGLNRELSHWWDLVRN